MTQDDFLPREMHAQLREFLHLEFKRQNTYPLINFPHQNLPPELGAFSSMMLAAFHEYCAAASLDITQFELNNFQVHSVPKYSRQMSNEHIMEPHHDLGEGGYTAIVYYVDFDESDSDEHFVGGELALYSELSSMEYPTGIIHVQPKENRLAMFPARVVHRVKPYFGDKPRMTIATLMRKERNYNQNKTIQKI
jgi:hypothetical protein